MKFEGETLLQFGRLGAKPPGTGTLAEVRRYNNILNPMLNNSEFPELFLRRNITAPEYDDFDSADMHDENPEFLRREISNEIADVLSKNKGNTYIKNRTKIPSSPLVYIQEDTKNRKGGVFLGVLDRLSKNQKKPLRSPQDKNVESSYNIPFIANLNDGYVPVKKALSSTMWDMLKRRYGVNSSEEFNLDEPVGANPRLQTIYDRQYDNLKKSITDNL